MKGIYFLLSSESFFNLLGNCLRRQNLSTYRELCSIANDLNQPDLIYKFMHLANHNASWNSKKVLIFQNKKLLSEKQKIVASWS